MSPKITRVVRAVEEKISFPQSPSNIEKLYHIFLVLIFCRI